MGSVNLVCISKPVIDGRVQSAGELVSYIARVSNPANQNNQETAGKLLRYLIKNQHFSPFEMVHMTMEITTTRDIARQILRHRSFSFQEFSQRYAVAENFVTREARLQDVKNRQNSIETEDDLLQRAWEIRQEHILEAVENSYQWALKNGIAKEQARAILPEGLTESRLYMGGSLRSFWHYILVRHHPATQKEHRIIAEQISDIIMHHFPDMRELLEEQIANNYQDGTNH